MSPGPTFSPDEAPTRITSGRETPGLVTLGPRLMLLGLALLLGISLHSLWAGYGMVGKTFSGFSMEFSFITFPVDSQDWTGSKADFQYYEQIRRVDGRVLPNIEAFRQYIHSLAPGTPVRYTVLREGKPAELTIATMVFSLTDYLKLFALNALMAWIYGGLCLFILLRRGRIRQSRVLLFLTFSFAAVYGLRTSYDYLHQFLPLALLSFGAFPLSLFLLGTHLLKTGPDSRVIPWINRLNLLVVGGLALSLAALSLQLADAPFEHPRALALFVSLYECLITSYLVNILALMGMVLWRCLRPQADELRRWQARIVLIGSLVSFLPYLGMMAAFWIFRMPWSLPSELIAVNTYLFVLFVFYAVLHNEGVALEAFVKKTVFYYVLLFVFGLAYTVVYRLVTLMSHASLLPPGQEATPFIAGLVAFVTVSASNSRLQQLIAAMFYRQRKSLTTLLEAFIEESTSTLEPQRIVELGLRFLQTAYAPQNLALYLTPEPHAGLPAALSLYYTENPGYPARLVLDTPLETPAQLEQFRQRCGLRDELLLPLHKGETQLGVILLDKKAGGMGYFAEDLQLLQTFAFYFVTGFYVACLSQRTLASYQKSEAAQRMEVLGTLASGVAHDFNNLLSTIVMSVGLLKYLSQDGQVLERLKVIQDSAEKGAAITRALSDYASTLPPDEAVSLHELLGDLQVELAATLPDSIRLNLSPPAGDTQLMADREQLLRALLELARNASIAMDGRGTLTIEVEAAGRLPGPAGPFEASDQEYLCIRVTDSGQGIPESVRARIFDPFFSAWTQGRGIGLGLSIARQIVRNHNGHLEFKSWEGEGSSFSVYLPLASQIQPRDLPAATSRAEARVTQPLILLIDDELSLRTLLAEALTRAGYTVLQAGDGQQGLEVFSQNRQAIGLVVCDLEMPRYDGRHFIACARKLAPALPILVSTGDLSRADEKAFRAEGIQILHKPYTPEQLLVAVNRIHAKV